MSPEETPKYRNLKVVLLGAMFVGKTCLSVRLTDNEFKQSAGSTIGASFSSVLLELGQQRVRLNVWDTAGSERYHSLAKMYYLEAHIAVLVYDITDRETFAILKHWQGEVEKYGPEDIVFVICGNKSDLESQRKVARAEGEDYAASIGALFIETSAMSSDASEIKAVFARAVARLPPKLEGDPVDENRFTLEKEPAASRGGCSC